jgi:hypothetical protein
VKFMVIRKADKNTEAGALPSTELLAAMMKYHQELANAGVLLDGMGLRPSSQGTRVTFSGGKPTVVDGPFAETKELIAGFTLIQVKSRAEAIAWVRRWPVEDGDVQLEIRQVFEVEDLAPAMTPESKEQFNRLLPQGSPKK